MTQVFDGLAVQKAMEQESQFPISDHDIFSAVPEYVIYEGQFKLPEMNADEIYLMRMERDMIESHLYGIYTANVNYHFSKTESTSYKQIFHKIDLQGVSLFSMENSGTLLKNGRCSMWFQDGHLHVKVSAKLVGGLENYIYSIMEGSKDSLGRRFVVDRYGTRKLINAPGAVRKGIPSSVGQNFKENIKFDVENVIQQFLMQNYNIEVSDERADKVIETERRRTEKKSMVVGRIRELTQAKNKRYYATVTSITENENKQKIQKYINKVNYNKRATRFDSIYKNLKSYGLKDNIIADIVAARAGKFNIWTSKISNTGTTLYDKITGGKS